MAAKIQTAPSSVASVAIDDRCHHIEVTAHRTWSQINVGAPVMRLISFAAVADSYSGSNWKMVGSVFCSSLEVLILVERSGGTCLAEARSDRPSRSRFRSTARQSLWYPYRLTVESVISD